MIGIIITFNTSLPFDSVYHYALGIMRYKQKEALHMFDLTGRVAVVSGASSGLGMQMARGNATQGATLVITACRRGKGIWQSGRIGELRRFRRQRRCA